MFIYIVLGEMFDGFEDDVVKEFWIYVWFYFFGFDGFFDDMD